MLDKSRIGSGCPSAAERSLFEGRRLLFGRSVDGLASRPMRAQFAWVGTALFLAVGIARAWRHEPWRDECGVWLLAQNCPTLEDLVQHLRYAGHPYLWPLLAWGLAHGTSSFFALQVLHLVLATAAVYLVLRHAPWPRWEAALCVLGYFFFFEYSIVCRAYVFALLGVALVGIAWQKRGDWPWIGGAGLFLLTQSSIYGVILALALVPLLCIACQQRARDRTATIGWCVGWGLPLAFGTAITIAMIVPPADADPAFPWILKYDGARLAQVAATFWRALVPLPDVTTRFPWNSNIADVLSGPMQGALGGLALMAALWTVRRDLVLLVYFFVAALGVLAFTYLKYYGSTRHHGHFYLALLMTMWLLGTRGRPGLPVSAAWFRRGVFVIQAVAGVWLAAADWTTPFSANRRAAEWIAKGDFGEYALAGSEAHATSGVGMHLARPIYYLNRECWGTFIIRNNHRRQFASPAELFESAATLSGESSKPVLLILNRKLPDQKGFRLRAGFRNSLIADERFFLYTYEPAGTSPTESRERGTVSEALSKRRPR